MTPRTPIHDTYDAVVDFFPPGAMPAFVYGLVKFTYDLASGRWRRGAVDPLFHDIRDAELQPRWVPGCDFWPTKEYTDVAVRGSAHGAGGRAVSTSTVRLGVGDTVRSIKVFGDRAIEWSAHRQLRFGAPLPFTEMPLRWTHAYGGWDSRVSFEKDPMTVADVARLEFDHPGVYPRNPFGRGYLVVDEPCEALLPNLEDPAQLLTPATLVTGDPALWYRQPMPVCLDFTSPMMYHRYCWVGADAWFPPPVGTHLREVDLGLLPADYHELRGNVTDSPILTQDAAFGLVFSPLPEGTPIVVEGMHPEQSRLQFSIPQPPQIEFYSEGQLFPVEAHLTNVLVEPGYPRVSLTYLARRSELSRVFIPGIHANISLAMRIDGDLIVVYKSPPTLREQRIQGEKKLAGSQ